MEVKNRSLTKLFFDKLKKILTEVKKSEQHAWLQMDYFRNFVQFKQLQFKHEAKTIRAISKLTCRDCLYFTAFVTNMSNPETSCTDYRFEKHPIVTDLENS